MYKKIIEKLNNRNIAILGFGREGKSSYNFIRKHLPNIKLTIIDKNDILSNNEYLKDDNNLSFVFGDNYLDNLDIYDLIIKSPGISFKDIDKEKLNGKITSQIELLLEVYRNNVIGVTGTKGKSTTTSLLYKVLKDQGKDTYLVGNIGVPVLEEIENYNENTILVMEMSSHQLEFLKVSPHIGIVLNLYEDHLDHAGSVENYHNSKMNMFKYQNESDISIYCYDCEALKNKVLNNNYKSISYKISDNKIDENTIYLDNNYVKFNNKKLYNKNDTRNLIGDHNLKNIMFILLVSELLKLNNDATIKSINSFIPLEHRLELVGSFNDVIYYNDTIATIPKATINGLKALENVDTLIFGGMDRGISYDELVEYLINNSTGNLICMPTTGHKVGNILKEKTNKNIIIVDTLEEAVIKAKEVTRKGMICLLSPAASSYEYFKNFEEKGKCYKDLIRKYN